MRKIVTFLIADRPVTFETGHVAKQANGAVLIKMDQTVVLGTATMGSKPREGLDFFPLVCDYEERKYAVGKIPGGFFKRGGRPSDRAILASRLIDRPIRPLFPKGMRHDVQCIGMPLAMDQSAPADVLAVNAVSAALHISDIPWNGPIGCVRVGRMNGEFILFPSVKQIEDGDLDLVVAGTKDDIVMIEAGAREIPEGELLQALQFAHEHIKEICAHIEALREEAGKPKAEVPLFLPPQDLLDLIRHEYLEEIRQAIVNPDKATRENALAELSADIVARLSAEHFSEQPEILSLLPQATDKVIEEEVRSLITQKQTRPDGRKPEEIRPITVEPGILPMVHGSGLFTRGQTQVLTVLTLGTPSEAQIMDTLEEVENKRYMHFYNFPPYSVGEVRPLRGPGRREIGHGALAERALLPVIPPKEEFPYTLHLVSEVLESNGSTSMASVCGSTIALLDCGVPIKAPVAGIAMGLIKSEDRFVVLTDIQGIEDFCGDMDFKVAGTREGITALQLDTKIFGVPFPILQSALEQARQARLYILDKIEEALPERRKELNPNAPRICTVQIDPLRVGELIGPAGKVIKRIILESGAEQIDVEQDGTVYILAKTTEALNKATQMVQGLMHAPEVGAVFTGSVTRILGRGVMVEYLPGKEGMVPLEELVPRRIRRADEVVKVGDTLRVRVTEIDQMNRVNLSALGLEQELPSLKENAGAESPRRPQREPDRTHGPRERHPSRSPRDHHPRRHEEPSREPQFRLREKPQHEPSPAKPDEDEPGLGARFRPRR
jgi:polyribonucleotide nucleotidyltransferase